VNLPPEEVARREAAGLPRAIRFRMPEGTTAYDDVVHGRIEFDNSVIEDFVVLRSDRYPTYHLSVVVDDIDMGITDVVRGDDHISNTPKQVLLYRAFGAPVPRFAHVPLILGPDKRRLSKRHGATSVMEYKRQGYLAEAMVNFLALLGWSPGNDREIFTKDELVQAFTLEGISSSNAVFNPEKLDWFNGEHIARMPAREIAARIEPLLREAGLWRNEYAGPLAGWLDQVIDLLKPRARKLEDFVARGKPFFVDRVEYDPAAVKKHLSAEHLAARMRALRDALASTDPFDAAGSEATLRRVASEQGTGAGPLIHATRVGVTGAAVSPGLFEVLALLGRERTVARLDDLVQFLAAGR
jgi:glutamyl-tRNA synthetase